MLRFWHMTQFIEQYNTYFKILAFFCKYILSKEKWNIFIFQSIFKQRKKCQFLTMHQKYLALDIKFKLVGVNEFILYCYIYQNITSKGYRIYLDFSYQYFDNVSIILRSRKKITLIISNHSKYLSFQWHQSNVTSPNSNEN